MFEGGARAISPLPEEQARPFVSAPQVDLLGRDHVSCVANKLISAVVYVFFW